MPQRLAPEVGKGLDGAVRLDDQPVIDPVDRDAATLQAEHLELSRKLRFRDHGDAGGGTRRSEVGALRDQRIDDLVRRFHLVGVDFDAGFLEQLFLDRDIVGGGLHDRQPGGRHLVHLVAGGMGAAAAGGHGGRDGGGEQE